MPNRRALIVVLVFSLAQLCAAQAARMPANHGAQFDVRDFGAAGNGSALDTDAIQKAARVDHVTGQRLLTGNDLSAASRAFSGTPRFTLSGDLLPGGKDTKTMPAK